MCPCAKDQKKAQKSLRQMSKSASRPGGSGTFAPAGQMGGSQCCQPRKALEARQASGGAQPPSAMRGVA